MAIATIKINSPSESIGVNYPLSPVKAVCYAKGIHAALNTVQKEIYAGIGPPCRERALVHTDLGARSNLVEHMQTLLVAQPFTVKS